MNEFVLDSSAVLAALLGETGGERVIEVAISSLICSVNHAEVIGKLINLGHSARDAQSLFNPPNIVPADLSLANMAGGLREQTRHRGLSLGDRFCLALAQRENLPVLTADRAWAGLDLGVEVVLIR